MQREASDAFSNSVHRSQMHLELHRILRNDLAFQTELFKVLKTILKELSRDIGTKSVDTTVNEMTDTTVSPMFIKLAWRNPNGLRNLVNLPAELNIHYPDGQDSEKQPKSGRRTSTIFSGTIFSLDLFIQRLHFVPKCANNCSGKTRYGRSTVTNLCCIYSIVFFVVCPYLYFHILRIIIITYYRSVYDQLEIIKLENSVNGGLGEE